MKYSTFRKPGPIKAGLSRCKEEAKSGSPRKFGRRSLTMAEQVASSLLLTYQIMAKITLTDIELREVIALVSKEIYETIDMHVNEWDICNSSEELRQKDISAENETLFKTIKERFSK